MNDFMVAAGVLVGMSAPLLLICRRLSGLTPIAIGLVVVAGLILAVDLVFNVLLGGWGPD